MQAAGEDLTLLNGALLHRSFVDAAVQEVWEAVEQSGRRELGEMAQQVALPLHFLREAIEARPMPGVLQAQTLYTNSFVEIERAMARAVLYALTQPTVLRSLCAEHRLQEDLFFSTLCALPLLSLPPSLSEQHCRFCRRTPQTDVERCVARLLDRLRHQRPLSARCTSAAVAACVSIRRIRSLTDNVVQIFLRVQSASVNSFFEQNEFVSVERLHSVGISRPDDHMRKHFPTALKLDSVFVSATFHSTVLSAAEDASSERSWADCSVGVALVPSELDRAHSLQLLRAADGVSLASGGH